MGITLTLSAKAEKRLQEEAYRVGVPPQQWATRTLESLLTDATPVAEALSLEESVLVSQINEGLPAAFWERYHALIARREAGGLTAEEQAELIRQTEIVEEKNLERTKLLIQLASLRGVSLPQIVAQLGLRPASVNP